MTNNRWQEIRRLYEAVQQLEAGARAAFLDHSCAGDQQLRDEVESLLAYQDRAEHFIEAPALQVAAKTLATDSAPTFGIGQTLSDYRVLAQLSAGGMSVVYKAEDVKLHRHVALKFLPKESAEDRSALERFRREARTIAALDHPNICTIYTTGEDRGRPFIVMQWLEGETLKQKVQRRPLELDELLNLAIQITDALDKVHSKDVIHRDIKPANIIVTKEGQAKILDFGIAKIKEPVQAARDADILESGLTGTGMILGTAGYMAPEQILGGPLDSRADLFSWGAVMYEMATGTPAFCANTLAGTNDQILHKDPVPPSHLNSRLPPGVDRIIKKALAKAPERRYQSAAELRSDLSTLKVGKEHDIARWILVPLVLIGLVAVVWWGVRGRQLNFNQLDTVMIGVVQNSTGDAALTGTISGALRIALEQSRYIDVLPTSRVRQALLRMHKSEEEIATDDVALAICRSEGAKILIAGTLSRPDKYLLNTRLVDCASGDSLRSLNVDIDTRDSILAAMDSMAQNLRLELGESARSVSQSHRRLAEATTSSLDALKAFTDGNILWSKGRYDDARLLFVRAVELDPAFAGAYASLGVSYASYDRVIDVQKAESYFQKALGLLDRVTERERLEIQALYHSSLGNPQTALSYKRLLVESYPKVDSYRFNLAREFQNLRQYSDAIREFQEVFRLNPNASNALINIAVCYGSLELVDQSIDYYKKAFSLAPERETDLILNHQYGWSLLLAGKETQARQVFEKMLAKSGLQKARGYRSFGIVALYRGRFQEAQRQLEEASRVHELSGAFNSAARDLVYLGEGLVLVGKTEEGVRQLDRAARLAEKVQLSAGETLSISIAYSRAGRIGPAAKWFEVGKQRARAGNAIDTEFVFRAEAELILSRKASEQSLEKLRKARSSNPGMPAELALALGLARTGHNREAIEMYEQIVSKSAPAWESQVAWVLAHRDLAVLYSESGQPEKARVMYRKMLELWADADSDLIPVNEVRQALGRHESGVVFTNSRRP